MYLSGPMDFVASRADEAKFGWRNRVVVGLTWLWSYLTFERGARLITGASSEAVGAAVPEGPPVVRRASA